MSRRILVISIISIGAIIGVAVSIFLLQTTDTSVSSSESTPNINNPIESEPTIEAAQTKLLFSGDVFWSRKTHFWAQNSEEKNRHPFSQLDTFQPEEYDAWIANLECPITSATLTNHELEVLLKFNCQPEYTPEAAKYFDVFSLATNHTDNQNEIDGFTKTKQHLTENNIQYFGHYDNKIDEICQVIQFPARTMTAEGKVLDRVTIPVALCGYHYVFRTPQPGEIEVISEYAKSMPTIAVPHMGKEYVAEPDQLKQSIYRQMIDAGAIAVIGSHPHWVQITEAYKGSLIAYSLGNFIFDQRWNEELMKGAVLDMELTIANDRVSVWIQTSRNCNQFDATCLDQLRQAYDASAIKTNYSIRSADSTGQQTTRGDDQLDQWLLERTNWDQTISQLN